VEAGTDSLLQTKFSVNGGLSDSVAASATLFSKRRDGYVKRADGTDMGDEDSLSARVALQWEISDTALLNVSADRMQGDTNGAPFTLVDVNRDAPFPTFHNAFLIPPAEGCFVPPPSGTGSTPSDNPLCYNEHYIPEDTTTDYGILPARDELDIFGVAATLTVDLTENLSFKSISSYRDTESEFALDQDHSPLTIAHVNSTSTQDQFTQEFQLLGSSPDARLNYVAGLYYFTEESAYFENVTFAPTAFRSGGSSDNDSKAVFAQFTYDFTDDLSVTAGARYTKDTKRFTPDQVIYSNNNDAVPPPLLGSGPGQVPPVPPPGTRILPNMEASIEVEETTPMVNLSYNWNDSLMTYITYSEGFKSGGFTQRVYPPQPDIPSFRPEYADVVELGFKLQTAGDRFRLNGAIFETQYEDLQIVSQAQTVAPLVLNAGEAEIRGFELDLQAAPVDGWLLELSAGYIDAKYKRVDAGTGISPDNKLVKTPELSAAAAASYTFDFAAGHTLTSRIDYMFRSDYFNNAINSAPLWQDDFDLINLSFAFESADSKWRVTAFGKNLGDEEYISAGYSESNGPTLNLGTSEVVRDRGRVIGLRVDYHLN
jgi:iron complex outermembrane receptor protein